MEIQKLIKQNELALRRFFEKYVLETYKIKIGTNTSDKILFDFHNSMNDTDPIHCAVFLSNKIAGYTDIIGFVEFDFADYEFIFYPKRKAPKLIIPC